MENWVHSLTVSKTIDDLHIRNLSIAGDSRVRLVRLDDFSDVESVAELNEIRSELFFNSQEVSEDSGEGWRVGAFNKSDSLFEESKIHSGIFEVVKVFGSGEGSKGQNACSQREDISLVLVGSDLIVLSWDLLQEFRGKERLDSHKSISKNTVSTLLSVISGVAELESFFSDENGCRGDFTMNDTLLLEFSKDRDHMLSQ